MNHILEYLPYPVSRDPVLFPTYTCIHHQFMFLLRLPK